MKPSDLLHRFRRAALLPGPPAPETDEEAEQERLRCLTSSELWMEHATALLAMMGLPSDRMSVHAVTDDLQLVLEDSGFWIGWAEARDQVGDVERAAIFRQIASDAERRRERFDWREEMARDVEREGDAARAARLRAMGAAERAKNEPALQAARARLSPTGNPGGVLAALPDLDVDDEDDDEGDDVNL